MLMLVSDMSSANLNRLKALVARRCPGYFNQQDREDVVGDILIDSWSAAARTGISVTKLAFINARRTSYYQRAAGRVVRNRSELTLDAAAPKAEDGEDWAVEHEVGVEVHEFSDMEIAAVIDTMDPVMQVVIVTCFQERVPVPEAAEMLGIPRATLYRHLRAALLA